MASGCRWCSAVLPWFDENYDQETSRPLHNNSCWLSRCLSRHPMILGKLDRRLWANHIPTSVRAEVNHLFSHKSEHQCADSYGPIHKIADPRSQVLSENGLAKREPALFQIIRPPCHVYLITMDSQRARSASVGEQLLPLFVELTKCKW